MASIQVKRAVSLVAAMFSLAGHAEGRELTNFAGSVVQLLTECAQTQLGGNCTIYDIRKDRRGTTADGELPKTRNGRTCITDLLAHPDSAMFVVRYRVDGSADRPSECRERAFALSGDGRSVRPISATTIGCK